MHVTLQPVAAQAGLSYGVIVRNEPRDDGFATRWLVKIDNNYAADRIRLTAITDLSPNLPTVVRPDGRRVDMGGSALHKGGKNQHLIFERPPKEMVFEVITSEPAVVEFDGELLD